MYSRIIEKLQQLPDPFYEDEYAKLASMVGFLDADNFNQFKAMLAANGTNLRPKALDFINKWYALSDSLVELEENTVATWYKLYPKKLIGNDQLLPLTLELLPNDVKLLEVMSKQMNVALKMQSANKASFLMLNFQSAIVKKLAEMKDHTQMIDGETEPAVFHVAQCIKNQEFLLQLKSQWRKYLQYLHEQLIEQPTVKLANLSENEFVNAIKKLISLDADKPTTGLIEKFSIIGDMYLSLTRQKTDAETVLDEFNAKFKHHLTYLKESAKLGVFSQNRVMPNWNSLFFAHSSRISEIYFIEKIAHMIDENEAKASKVCDVKLKQ